MNINRILREPRFPIDDTNLPKAEDLLNLDFAEDEFTKHLMSLKMRDAMMPDEERTSPDTFGCDCVFLEHFLTEEMEDDFSLIAKDFLMHEYADFKDREMVQYLDTDPAVNWPDRVFEKHVLNMMMNAVNYGSEYTKSLFIYLYKTYYSKEYKQLKRFSSLSVEELMSLSRIPNGGTSPISFSRILTISRMSGINISPECNFLYLFLDDYHETSEDGPDWDFIDGVSDLYKECKEEIHEIFENDEEMYDLYYKYDRFLGNILRSEGYVEDYVMLCNDNNHGIENRLARTLSVLKKTFRNKQFSKEELILYASIYETAQALMCTAEEVYERLNELTRRDEDRESGGVYHLFNAEDVAKSRTEKASSGKPRREEKQEAEEKKDSPRYKEETLIAEIDTLHRAIHQYEGEVKELKNEIKEFRRVIEENKQLKEQLDSEHDELSALREHVYNMTEDYEATDSVSVDAMKGYLRTLKIIIVGGHSNWRQKMKQEFPDWTYIDASVSGTLESSIVDKADHVYFFTDSISHSTYFKYMNIVRDHDVNYGYIHGVNIENTVRKIYKELKLK